MKFVDRIDEAARLKDALAREKSSLVVMYGRRRLGKSTLVKRMLSDNDVYFLADRSEGQHQRMLLAKVIAQVFPDFDKLTYCQDFDNNVLYRYWRKPSFRDCCTMQ